MLSCLTDGSPRRAGLREGDRVVRASCDPHEPRQDVGQESGVRPVSVDQNESGRGLSESFEPAGDGVGDQAARRMSAQEWTCPGHRTTGPPDLRFSCAGRVGCAMPVRAFYSPGVMRCAVVVPAFIIHTMPCLLVSGSPVDCVVAPGTAMVMCVRACSRSAPMK